MSVTGLFLVTTKLAGNRAAPSRDSPPALAGSVANCVKTLTRADAVERRAAKPGLLVWTVVQSAVAPPRSVQE